MNRPQTSYSFDYDKLANTGGISGFTITWEDFCKAAHLPETVRLLKITIHGLDNPELDIVMINGEES
jgi:hypothetical protein